MAEDTQVTQAFLLKILTGDHQGAEVALEKESLWIGQSEDCDIVLSDSSLLPKHLKIEVQQNVYSLVPQPDAKTYVNGKLLTQPTTPQPFQYISLGSTLIAIGPANEPWPNLSSNLAPPLEAEAPPPAPVTQTPPSQQETQSITGAPPGPHQGPSDGQQTSEKGGTDKDHPQTPQPTSSQETPGNASLKRKKIAVYGGAICTFLLVLITTMHISKRSTRLPKEELIPSIQKILSDLKLQKLVEIKQDGPIPFVTGCVNTKAEKRLLSEALQPFVETQSITVKLLSQEKLMLGLKELISSVSAPLTIKPSEKLGAFTITGYLGDADQVAAFQQRAKEDLPDIEHLTLNIVSADEVYTTALNILKKHQLNTLIAPITLSTGLLIQGSIDSQRLPTWETAKKELTASFNNLCPIIFRVTVVTSDKLKAIKDLKKQNIFFDSAIESITISTDGVNCIDLQNGKRYFERSLLPTGYMISKITKSTITLSKGNEEIELLISDL